MYALSMGRTRQVEAGGGKPWWGGDGVLSFQAKKAYEPWLEVKARSVLGKQ